MDIKKQFEIQKGRTIQYSLKELLRFSIRDYLILEVTERDNELGNSLRLISKINSKEDLCILKLFLNDNKNKLGDELYSALFDETKEMSEDFRWSRTKDGKLVIKIESWIEEQRKILGDKWPNELIYIGRSFDEPISLIIGGLVSSNLKDEVVEFFNSKEPPISVHYMF